MRGLGFRFSKKEIIGFVYGDIMDLSRDHMGCIGAYWIVEKRMEPTTGYRA